MHPRPIAETSRPLLPSLRFCIIVSVDAKLLAVRQEPKRRGACLKTHYRVDNSCPIAAVLGAVRKVDGVTKFGIRVGEDHFFSDAAGANAACVPYLGTAKPTGDAPVH